MQSPFLLVELLLGRWVLLVVVVKSWLLLVAELAYGMGFACGQGLALCLKFGPSKLLQRHSGMVAATHSKWFGIGFRFEVAVDSRCSAVGGALGPTLNSESAGCVFVG